MSIAFFCPHVACTKIQGLPLCPIIISALISDKDSYVCSSYTVLIYAYNLETCALKKHRITESFSQEETSGGLLCYLLPKAGWDTGSHQVVGALYGWVLKTSKSWLSSQWFWFFLYSLSKPSPFSASGHHFLFSCHTSLWRTWLHLFAGLSVGTRGCCWVSQQPSLLQAKESPLPHPLLLVSALQVELHWWWKSLCWQEAAAYLLYQLVTSFNLVHSIMKVVTALGSSLGAYMVNSWLIHVSLFSLKRRVPSSSWSSTQSLARFCKAMNMHSFFMSTPASRQASFKHREGVDCLLCFSIQKEKPVKREATTKEHSRGKFA